MAEYAFVTLWWFDAPREAVWERIARPLEWPGWWRGVERVEEIEPGDGNGLGSLRRYTWKSRLPYRLVFDLRTTRVERPRLLEGTATGELEGTGRWTLREEDGGTSVRYDWVVRTTKPWMELLAPLARPLFEWNHDVVMRWGEEGLRHLLRRGTEPEGGAAARTSR